MKNVLLLSGLLSCIAFTSCKSVKNIAAKDNSRPSKNNGSSKSDNPQFIDSISITPGSITSGSFDYASSTNTGYKKTYATYNLEGAAQVQFKYATMLDIAVEDVSNLVLFENIDYWWGTKYCRGGSTESCIDCSSFTQRILQEVYRVHIPRTARQQYDSSSHIEPHELTEGDLVFFQTSGKNISHVGVYIANNKFAHASVSSGVMISDLNESYWKTRFRGAGRVMK